MIKAFEPSFNMRSLLDLDSFKGDFARKFLSCFDAITGIKTSDMDCRCAYLSDTLERDAVAATLKLIHRPEVFLMRKRVGQMRISSAVIAQILELDKLCLRRPCP
ncbi:hypothetical protein V2P20_00875 [Methylobacter sp. Wu1]|uniref:hypothetical protein n=1 Tax=Methylobacter sp. Wu1 TaxID=3119359 RepID=UPI002F92CBB8